MKLCRHNGSETGQTNTMRLVIDVGLVQLRTQGLTSGRARAVTEDYVLSVIRDALASSLTPVDALYVSFWKDE